MFNLVKKRLAVKSTLLAASFALACFNQAVAGEYPQLEQKLDSLGFVDYEIAKSPIDNLLSVVTKEGVFLADKSGNYLIQGSLYKLENGGFENITNKIILPKLSQQKTIEYKAAQEKYKVYVFTDITCHYCNLLHQKIDEYNKLGITLEFLAFPRNGLNSKNAQRMEAIWLSKDPKKDISLGFEGRYKETAQPNIVVDEYNLGLMFGVNGTPNIISPKGEIIAGYLPPEKLLQALER